MIIIIYLVTFLTRFVLRPNYMVILLRIFLHLVRPYENFSKVSYSKIQYSNVEIIFLRSCKIYKYYTILYENLWKFLEKNLLIFMYFLMHPLKNLLKLQWTFIKYETLFKKEVEGWQCPPPLVFVSLVQWHLRDLLIFRNQ